MKTIIKFNSRIENMLKANGNDLVAVVDACQSDANKFVRDDSSAKRGAYKGGHSYKADGTLAKIKGIEVSESVKFAGTATAPGELVKFNDALENLWRKTGYPVGDTVPADMLPVYVHSWLRDKCRAVVVEKPDGKRKPVEA